MFMELGYPFQKKLFSKEAKLNLATSSDVVLVASSDVVLRPHNNRALSWGHMCRPLTLSAVRYAGLAKADERKTISFVSFGFGLAELLWGNQADIKTLLDLGRPTDSRITYSAETHAGEEKSSPRRRRW